MAETTSDFQVPDSADSVTQIIEDHGPRRGASRDVPIATIVHLLGIPTQTDINVLDTKLDMLTSKVNALALKVDRLLSQLAGISNEFYVDRIDFQLADIRNMMKKVFPQALTTTEATVKDAVSRKAEKAQGKSPEKASSKPSAKPEPKADAADAPAAPAAEAAPAETTAPVTPAADQATIASEPNKGNAV